MSNNTRTLRNRSSRFSSPATFTAVNQESPAPVHEDNKHQRSTENGVDRQPQSQAQQGPWIEPVVRNGVPSFEDTKGLERVGVLEHMQPLGALPNPKLLQRLKVNLGSRISFGNASARATPIYSEGVASPASQPTESARHDLPSPVIDPELLDVPSPPVPQSQPETQSQPLPVAQAATQPPPMSQSPSQTQQHSPPLSQPFPCVPQPAYAPSIPLSHIPVRPDPPSIPRPQQPSPQVIMSPPRGRPAKKEVEEMRAYNPDDAMMPPAMASIMRPSRASPRYSSSSFSEQNREERFRASLQNAINRAVAEGKHEIEAGLRKVLQESGRDELTTALDNISKYKANVPINQFKVFKHFVKKGIRKHRKSSAHSSLSSNNDQGPSPPSSQPAAYVSTFRTKQPSSPAANERSGKQGRSPLILRSSQLANINSNSSTMPTDQSPEHTEVADLPTITDLTRKTTSRKRRSGSTSSLSSLSSANLSDYAPPEMAIPVRDQATEGRPSRSVTQRQASARTAAGRPTRSSGIGLDPNSQLDASAHPAALNYAGIESNTSHRTKKLRLTHIDAANDEEIARQRALLEKNIVRESAYNARTIFSRTPSPTRRTRSEAQQEERIRRGFSPKPSRLRPGPPPPVIHPEALMSSTNFEPSSPVSAQGDGPLTNGTSRKRDHDEFARDDHSDRLSSLGPTPPPPLRASLHARHSIGAPSTRSSTPRLAKESRPSRIRRARIVDTS